MAGASDKARFYLEQTVPELREWERRKIFTKDELRSINSKRSEFEHVICSRGSSTSATYASYIAYEVNLVALVKKRVQRLSLAESTHTTKNSRHSGQARILDLLKRGTSKHSGDLALWMQYLDFCRKSGASKRRQRVQTQILRLFPTRGEVWVKAAKDAERTGSTVQARGLLRRGLRLCGDPGKKVLLLEWLQLEMRWLASVERKKSVLGLRHAEKGVPKEKENETVDQQSEEDLIDLPEDDGQTSSKPLIDDSTVKELLSTTALHGAIPIAIFDAALKEFPRDDNFLQQFFNLAIEFPHVPATIKILQHIIDKLGTLKPGSALFAVCRCKILLLGVTVDSPEFPKAIRQMLKETKSSMSMLTDQRSKADLARILIHDFETLEADPKVGPEMKQVLAATIRQLRAVDS